MDSKLCLTPGLNCSCSTVKNLSTPYLILKQPILNVTVRHYPLGVTWLWGLNFGVSWEYKSFTPNS